MSVSSTRVCPTQQSQLQIKPLADGETRKALLVLQQVFQTCYGPHGKLKLVHNNREGQASGHVILTSASGRLLQGVSVSRPVIKLIKSAIQEHLRLYSDGGTLIGTFSLLLINSCLELDIHRRLIMETHDLLLSWCVAVLESEQCACRIRINVTDLDVLLKIVKTVISTKNGCSLLGTDLTHICDLVVRAFLQTFQAGSPQSTAVQFGTVKCLAVEGAPPKDSRTISGLLFPCPHIPVYTKNPPRVHAVKGGPHHGLIRVLLCNISMSGDSQDFVDAAYELEEGVDLGQVVLQRIEDCVQRMSEEGVGLLVCQKVVHPTIKRLCRENGMMVLDRLGIDYVRSLQELTGGELLAVLQPAAIQESSFGYLRECRHLVLHEKSYMHMEGVDSKVCTLVLCGRSEEALEELKYVCEAARHVLQLTVSEPLVFTGAGCWQTWLANYLWQKALTEAEEAVSTLGCTKAQFFAVAQNFVRCLLKIAMATAKNSDSHAIDSTNHHLWIDVESDGSATLTQSSSACQCGMITRTNSLKFDYLEEKGSLFTTILEQSQESLPQQEIGNCLVLDSYLPCVNALKTAVSLGNLILGIHQYVHNDT